MKTYEEVSFDLVFKEIKENINNSLELKEIEKAYYFALDIHKGMKRLNGEDFITHPLNVARIVNSLNVDATTIISALIHEVLNNGKLEVDDIERVFGHTVATIVDSVSKINKLELVDASESSAIYLRKILVGLATDVRVLYIKLADRLHNMRTNYAIEEKKQKEKAYETQAVLIPIAHRLGINSIKSELEDLCLYYTKPDVYQDILDKLNESREELNNELKIMEQSITDILTKNGLKFKIKSRVKSVHSIYNKLAVGRDWSDIYDILALRVILDEVSDCYMAVGLVHAKYKPIPKRFKDFIAMPKANMYQSLHTTVFGINGRKFEIQFRTYEMDELAEKGMASHWSYKEHGTKKIQNLMDQKLELFRSLIESNGELDDITFAENVNRDMLAEMIYVFTPKGDVIELPKGATPVDFAYRIHSDVGDKMVSAIVNDFIVPLSHELNNNDIVKIKTSSVSTPNKDWLNFVKTTQAKNKIKAYFSKKERASLIIKGKNIFEKELRKRKNSLVSFLNDENINKILKELNLDNLDDLYLSIGSLRFTVGYILSLVSDKTGSDDIILEKVNRNKNDVINYKNDVIVAGMDNLLVNLAKCCKPVKGEPIIGFVTKGEGITVHKKDCLNLNNKNERLIDVSWNNNISSLYYTDIYIDTDNIKNYITDIVALLTKKNVHIDSFKTKEYVNNNTFIITLKVKDINELNKIISELEKLSYVMKVRRMNYAGYRTKKS